METGWFHMTQGRLDPARRRNGGRRAAVYKRLLEHPGLAR